MSDTEGNSLSNWSRIIMGPCEATDDEGRECTLARGHVVAHEFEEID